MKLRYLFIILVLFLLVVFGLLVYQIPQNHHTLTYLSEGLVVLILLYLIYFYRRAIKPYRTISNGMELLKEQDFNTRLCEVKQPEADVIVDIFNRMMDRLKDERLQVREQNYFLDLLIKASPMGVVLFDYDGHVAQCNDAAVGLFEYGKADDIKGKTLDEIDSPLAESIAGMQKGVTVTFRLGDSRVFRCSKLSFLDHGFSHPFVLIETLTSEVMVAEKKAYEKVIRMIGHEVNNTTAGIISTLDSVSSTLQDMDEMEDLRNVIGVCIERCNSMSRFITNFADVVKIPEPELISVDLNKEINSCKIFMENLCNDRHIALHLKLYPHELIVNMDASLFEQVVINIVKNAAESIGCNGDIYINTWADPSAGLEIVDNGTGIDKETEYKLFTPFFSTKPNGQGLGLIFIREILSKHRCTFSLRTYRDGLTRFKIQFPGSIKNAIT